MAASLSNEKLDSKTAIEQCYENLIVIDIGANLTNKKYSRDLDSVVQRAKDAGKAELHLLNYVKRCCETSPYPVFSLRQSCDLWG